MGWAFLPQFTEGRYRDIEVSAQDVPAPDVSKTTVEASLFGAFLPPSNLFGRRFAYLPVTQLYGRIRVDAGDLGQALGIPDLEISEPERADGAPEPTRLTRPAAVVLTGTVPVGDEEDTIAVDANLAMDGDRFRIEPTELHVGPDGNTDADLSDADLSDAELAGVLAEFSGVIDAGSLPFGVPVTWIYTEGAQIVLEGTVEDVTVDLTELRQPTTSRSE